MNAEDCMWKPAESFRGILAVQKARRSGGIMGGHHRRKVSVGFVPTSDMRQLQENLLCTGRVEHSVLQRSAAPAQFSPVSQPHLKLA